MKVCIIAPEFLPNWGGVGSYCIELARFLTDKVELHVATLSREREGREVYTAREIEDFLGGSARVHILASSSIEDTFLYNGRFQMAVSRLMPQVVKENGIQLLHTHFPPMPDILLKLLGANKVPDLVTLHTTIEGQRSGTRASGLGLLDMDFSEKCTLLLYPALTLAENVYLRKSRHFVTVSRWMKRAIHEKYPFVSNIRVVHNGVDPRKFSPRLPQNIPLLDGISEPTVLFSSRLTTAKGAHYLIQAIPQIIREIHHSVHFVFSGAGNPKTWIKLLRELDISQKYYTFLGYIDYKLLPALYSEADIFVAPTLYDNLPIRMLEAMSSGAAVIASRVGAIPEVIADGHNGLLIQPGKVDALVSALLTLLQDHRLRRRLGVNARQTIVEKFSWEIASKKLLDIYKRILSDPHS